jgi:hypothetical protein
MTSRERIDAALRGEKPDQVPIFLRDLTLALDVCDYSTPEVCAGPNGYDADKSACCVVETNRLVRCDATISLRVQRLPTSSWANASGWTCSAMTSPLSMLARSWPLLQMNARS